MLSFKGDTGPYLQYAHVRLSSIERENGPELLPVPAPSPLKKELLVEPPPCNIAFLLGSYPDVAKTALKTHEPSGLWDRDIRVQAVAHDLERVGASDCQERGGRGESEGAHGTVPHRARRAWGRAPRAEHPATRADVRVRRFRVRHPRQ